jgi:hypothetical protein
LCNSRATLVLAGCAAVAVIGVAATLVRYDLKLSGGLEELAALPRGLRDVLSGVEARLAPWAPPPWCESGRAEPAGRADAEPV